VGNTLTNPGVENDVAVYVDGFYITSSVSSIFDFNNIEQVQVLKGPQGTLYGRNATGGAILVDTRTPSFGPRAEMQVTAASYGDYRLSLYGSAGISDKLAFDLAGYARSSNGYTHDLLTGANTSPLREASVRTKFLLQPATDWRVLLIFQAGYNKDGSGLALTALNGNTSAKQKNPLTPIATAPRVTSLNFAPQTAYQTAFSGARIDGKVGNVALTSLTSFSTESDHFAYDSDRTYISATTIGPWNRFYRTITEDIYASANFDRLDIIAGASYYSNLTQDRFLILNGAGTTIPSSRADAAAGYVTATYRVGDRLFLNGGVRYSSEHRRFQLRNPQSGALTENDDGTFSALTPGGSVRFEIDMHQDIYASVETGFKSGFYVSGNAGLPVSPETITAYELGYKLARTHLRFDVAAYYYDYRNLQVSVYQTTATSLLTRVLNAAKARIEGLEATVAVNPNAFVDAQLGVAYTSAKFVSFPNAVDNVPLPNGGNSVPILDASGRDLLRSPHLTGNFQINFHPPVPVGKVTLSANYSFSSRINFIFSGRINQPAYGVFGFRSEWATDDGKFTVGVFGNNVGGEKYLSTTFVTASGDFVGWGPPATYGVSIGVRN